MSFKIYFTAREKREREREERERESNDTSIAMRNETLVFHQIRNEARTPKVFSCVDSFRENNERL